MLYEIRGIPHRGVVLLFDSAIDIEKTFELAQDLFGAANLVPNLLATDQSSKVVDYRRGERALRKRGFSSTKGFNMLTVPEYLERDFTRGFFGFVSASNEWNAIDFSIRASFLSEASLGRFCDLFADLGTPIYGYRDTFSYAGAFEMGYNLDFQEFNLALGGFIRKLFPWNVVNGWHLRRQIEGDTLQKWIARNPERGMLTPYVNKSWVWLVDPKEVERVSERLMSANILYDREKHSDPWERAYHLDIVSEKMTRAQAVGLMVEQIQKTGIMPPPPHIDPVGKSSTEEVADILDRLGFKREGGDFAIRRKS